MLCSRQWSTSGFLPCARDLWSSLHIWLASAPTPSLPLKLNRSTGQTTSHHPSLAQSSASAAGTDLCLLPPPQGLETPLQSEQQSSALPRQASASQHEPGRPAAAHTLSGGSGPLSLHGVSAASSVPLMNHYFRS